MRNLPNYSITPEKGKDLVSYAEDLDLLITTEHTQDEVEKRRARQQELGISGREPLSILVRYLCWGVRSREKAPGIYERLEQPIWKKMSTLDRFHLWNIWRHVRRPQNLCVAHRRVIINLIIEKSDANERVTHAHPLVRAGQIISDYEPIDSEIELRGI